MKPLLAALQLAEPLVLRMNAAQDASQPGAVFGSEQGQRACQVGLVLRPGCLGLEEQDDLRGQVGDAVLIAADDLVVRQGDGLVAAADPPSVALRFPEDIQPVDPLLACLMCGAVESVRDQIKVACW